MALSALSNDDITCRIGCTTTTLSTTAKSTSTTFPEVIWTRESLLFSSNFHLDSIYSKEMIWTISKRVYMLNCNTIIHAEFFSKDGRTHARIARMLKESLYID